MSEPWQEPSEDDAPDWRAAEFGDDDYLDDDTVAEMVVEVADGTQRDAPGDDQGWAAETAEQSSRDGGS